MQNQSSSLVYPELDRRVTSFLCSFVVFILVGSFVSFSFAGQLIYSTFLGGNGEDYGSSIAIP